MDRSVSIKALSKRGRHQKVTSPKKSAPRNSVDNFNLEYVLVRPEVDAALVLAAELVRRHEVGVDRLEHDLVPRGAVLGQVHAAVPALADQLHQVVLGVDVHLTQNIDIKIFYEVL